MWKTVWSLNADRFLIHSLPGGSQVIKPDDSRFRLLQTAIYGDKHDLLEDIVLGNVTKVETTNPRWPSLDIGKKPLIVSNQDQQKWDALDSMDMFGLLTQPLMELRPYATFRVGVKKASKIPGGKPALVNAIMEARG